MRRRGLNPELWKPLAERSESAIAWRVRKKIREAAHAAVALALREGRLQRPATCSRCGSPGRQRQGVSGSHGVVAHHPDYAEQLSVVWLCATCHRRLHAAEHAAVAA